MQVYLTWPNYFVWNSISDYSIKFLPFLSSSLSNEFYPSLVAAS